MENVENANQNAENTKKRIMLGSLIIVVSIIIIGISLSYAYFVNTVQEVNPENQGANITSGELTMNFSTSQYINAANAGLVNDANVLTDANYTAFSITLPSDASASSANYSIYLTEIKMTQNFKSGYVKWALYNAENISIASGTFNDAVLASADNGDGTYNAENIVIEDALTINKGDTTSYRLYIWLSNDPSVNQIDLLNGSLSAKVGFRATTG